MSGIYAILNLITGVYYIGSAINLYKRWHIHKSSLIGNYHDNSYLQNAWNKYGQINFMFVILEYTDNLVEREQYWIDILCYNKEVSYNLRKIANSNLGINFSEEGKRNISNSKLGISVSLKTRIKMSKASPNRDKVRWPHELGAKCQCDECKEKWKLRNKEHMREWRASNREKNNEYMRNYRLKQIGSRL